MTIKKLLLHSSNYPPLLREIPDPPKALYYLGQDISVLSIPSLAVVGSRKVSHYGKTVTELLASQLARGGISITSGLALGVDSIAHKAALETQGLTIAVLPCGLDRIYPSSHTTLAKQILLNGGLIVSEYPSGIAPMKHHFIARNRIISGLCKGVLITEAAERSGSLHTANFALEQGRDVFAVPGPITSSMSLGTNNLIKLGAVPVTSSEDIFSFFGLEFSTTKTHSTGNGAAELSIIKQLQSGIIESDLLLLATELSPDQFYDSITKLEIKGQIKSIGNNQWGLL